MSTKRFRIAFSFAGEKRDFVEKTALILANTFRKEEILYDKFHESEFAVFDLGIKLPKLYGEQSDLIVPVICKQYDQKRWTGWEWLQIYGLLTKDHGHRVMPSRFDHAIADGLSPASGYIELDNKTPEQFAALILERLAGNEGRPRDFYTRSTGTVFTAHIPNNLPRLPYFFGRDAELKKISEALSQDSRGWGALIDGPGGIGKTALAVRAAQQVPVGRFRRIIFLSSKERELTADGQKALGHFVLPSYLEMLNAITRELGKPELAKSPGSERSDAILRALRETDTLLVLDNLETLPEGDRDQLFAFLNRLPQDCSAIVTSRRRADASAVAVRLDKLDWPAAEKLLSAMAENNDKLAQASTAERRSLYEETGGNPLLMRWVAGQLHLGRRRTITSALDFLRSAPAGNNPLEFIFGDLLDTFSSNETLVMAALTYFTSPMPVRFIAELACLNEAAAEGALTDLSSRALVLPDLEENNFVLVPMVADFLRKHRPQAIQETGNRLEKRAYALIIENGYQNYDRFPTLNESWFTVAPALPIFMFGPNPRLQTVCDALDDFLHFTGRWDEWLSLSQQAEEKAIAAGDDYNAGWRAYQGGFVCALRGQIEETLASAARAEAHWQQAKAGARERAIVLHLRGIAYQLKEDYPAAAASNREALHLDRSLSIESRDVSLDLNSLAGIERLSGDLASAEGHYREALRIAGKMDDTVGVALYTGNLALLMQDRKDWPASEALAREALSLAEKLGRQNLIASNCSRIARALTCQSRSIEALPYARRAVEIYTLLGSPDIAMAQEVLEECGG